MLQQENTTVDIDTLTKSIATVSAHLTELNKNELRRIQDAERLLAASVPQIGAACANVPTYVIPNSISVITDVSKEQGAAAKKAQVLRTLFETPQAATASQSQTQPSTTPEPLLSSLNACNSQLQLVNAGLLENATNLDKFISQGFTDLQALSTALVSAQQSGETLVANSIASNIHDKRDFLSWAQQEQAIIKNIGTSLASLQSRVTAMLNFVIVPPSDAKAATSVATDVFQTIEENLLKFLLFSLILGQILDPIQRGAISFFGPRRNFFGAFNKVYGQRGDGEFRYGDRRLEPWVSNDAFGSIDERQSEVVSAELRRNAAGNAFKKDRNIYDKNYAVGAGYVTQSEVKVIEDEYFTQSQITSGLIIPMFILSACVAIRMICCSAVAAKAQNGTDNVLLAGAAISAGTVTGLILMIFALLASSKKYWKVFFDGARGVGRSFKELRRGQYECKVRPSAPVTATQRQEWNEVENESHPSWIRISTFGFIFLILLTYWIWAFIVLPGSDSIGLNTWELVLISLPAVLIGPFWIAGLDRLHKYYSELEARIAGNILRLQESTQQKILDLIADPSAAAALKTKIDNQVAGQAEVANFLATIVRSSSDTSATPPAGPADPTTPGGPPKQDAGGGEGKAS